VKPFVALSCLFFILISPDAFAYSCSIVATPLNFGAVEGRPGPAQHSMATLTVVCQSDASPVSVNYQILFGDEGAGKRSMTGIHGEAGYQLYTSSSYQQVWGDTADSAISDSYYLAAHTTESRSYTVYARMQPDRSMSTGQYTGMSSVRLMY